MALGIRLQQPRQELALRRRVSVRLDMVARALLVLVLHVPLEAIRRLREIPSVLNAAHCNICLLLDMILLLTPAQAVVLAIPIRKQVKVDPALNMVVYVPLGMSELIVLRGLLVSFVSLEISKHP